MAYSYKPVDRSQPFLLPPDVRDWLPEGHLVWLVVDVVQRLDTAVLHARHGNDGVGRQAYDPDMLLALLIYAYCTGVRSSRAIERLCVVDVAYRVVCANQVPDHTTIARFRQAHQRVAQSLFVDVLAVCARAGLARVGVVAVDGTKMAANASMKANRSRAQMEAEIAEMFAQAEAVDAAENGLFGDRRGDELPDDLVDPRRRGPRLDAALALVAAEEARRQGGPAAAAEGGHHDQDGGIPTGRARVDQEVARAEAYLERVKRRAGAARQQKQARAAAAGKALPAPTVHPEGCRVAAAEAHLAAVKARAGPRAAQAHRRRAAEARANVTDPDSRIMRTPGGWVQGYNAQAAANQLGVIVAAAVTQDHNDMGQCTPMMTAVLDNLDAAGIDEPVGTMLFDAGYCSADNLTAPGPDRLIATTKSWKLRRAARHDGHPSSDAPAHATPAQAMEHRLRTEQGAALYRLRQHTIEPVFAQNKFNRGFGRFTRRGRDAADAEWKLIATAHNILKLFTATTTPAPAT
jgi:transposase